MTPVQARILWKQLLASLCIKQTCAGKPRHLKIKHWVNVLHVCASQVEDSSKLEYQAGQEEEEGDGKDKRKPEAQKKQQEQETGAEADKDRQGGEGDEEEGGVNEDVDDKYEESHFAPPTAPEQVRLSGV